MVVSTSGLVDTKCDDVYYLADVSLENGVEFESYHKQTSSINYLTDKSYENGLRDFPEFVNNISPFKDNTEAFKPVQNEH